MLKLTPGLSASKLSALESCLQQQALAAKLVTMETLAEV